jgi:phosphoribosyl 1,2-cyclic phosphodiesterase
MKVTLWGTRGSLAAPGPETMRYGGNTSCVEVRGADGTHLILDSGTGIRRLGETIEPGGKRIDLLLTHLHMDHIQGLGFFDPLFEPGLEAHIWGPSSSTLDLGGRLARYLSPPLFPVYLCNLPCRLTLHDVVSLRRFRIGGLEIEADLVCHPGPTVGYRISEGDASFVYLPDHEPALGVDHCPSDPRWLSGFDLAVGADLLIHDMQYTSEEYREHVGWGHSSIQHALEFAALTGVRHLVGFHHDPAHSDIILDRLFDDARSSFEGSFQLTAAAEGASFKLGADV